MRIALVGAAAAGLIAALVGCGDDKYACEDMCQKTNTCLAADETASDCDQTCAAIEKVNQGGSCDEAFDLVLLCLDKHEDTICDDTDTACNAEMTAWAFCTLQYCMQSPTPAECAQLPE